MTEEKREPAGEAYPGGVPPEWQVTVRRTVKEDGRYLIYYEFAPSPAAAETELQPAQETGKKQCS